MRWAFTAGPVLTPLTAGAQPAAKTQSANARVALRRVVSGIVRLPLARDAPAQGRPSPIPARRRGVSWNLDDGRGDAKAKATSTAAHPRAPDGRHSAS